MTDRTDCGCNQNEILGLNIKILINISNLLQSATHETLQSNLARTISTSAVGRETVKHDNWLLWSSG